MRVWVLAMVAACVVLTGCGDKPVPPFASAPFSVARKGNVLSIPFVVPPDADLSYIYMLAFKYQRPEQDDPISLFWGWPKRASLRLRVKLVHVVNGIDMRLPINDHSETYDPTTKVMAYTRSMEERETDVANVTMSSHARGIANMEVVRFVLPSPGTYRVDVETIGDMAIFEPISSWLTVEREYRHVK